MPTSDPVILVLILTTLSLAPFVVMMVTSFTKISIVLNLIRQALGVQQIPPNIVLNALSMILSIYIMAPTAGKTLDLCVVAKQEYEQRKKTLTATTSQETRFQENYEKTFGDFKKIVASCKQPIEDFLFRHSKYTNRMFFVKTAKKLWPKEMADDVQERDLLVLVPAFTLSELTSAFEIGFLIYLPFIAIDLIVSNILLAMGMMMVSPMTISLPFKLMLFVLVDGWNKLIEGLVLSYR
jgi:type III secretion protein R